MTKVIAAPPKPYSLALDALPQGVAEAVIGGAVVAVADVAVVGVSGPGAIACLQGLLTNDVQAAGDGGFLYGAVLTNKGNIVCDLWTATGSGSMWLSIPMQGKDALLDVFKRSLPPRLARVTDRSDELTVLRLAGPEAGPAARRAGIAIPDPGMSTTAVVGEAACVVSRPTEPADFYLQIQLARDRGPAVLQSLNDGGVVQSGPEALELSRILAGWPRLGAEIDEKTLPQEVRYDDINGVSYTKGCYIGQETVARLHFRGHTNKGLRGLVWDDAPDISEAAIVQDDKPVGRVTSIAWLSQYEQHVGLGMIHRRADAERAVSAAGATAGIVGLPFELDS